MISSCVTPAGFRVGVHKPSYRVVNLREDDVVGSLGQLTDGTAVENRVNFPQDDLVVEQARPIYEIPNPLPFRGTTYIDSGWADGRADRPESIRVDPPPPCSLKEVLEGYLDAEHLERIWSMLPRPVLYSLAANSTDSEELVLLARHCCRFLFNSAGEPEGLMYEKVDGQIRAVIDDFELFETIANNPHLPDRYKEVMVLRPGVQGGSEIVGETRREKTHVFEYCRRNSYIPWGHFAANMAHDCIRYRTLDLDGADMQGLRHLYYQRSYVAMAQRLGLPVEARRRMLAPDELETLRRAIVKKIGEDGCEGVATLWGWNYGYDFSGSGFRLHASHQMIHQQYAMIPEQVATLDGGIMPAYGCGDQVSEVIDRYRHVYDRDFFSDYLAAIHGNTRMDGREDLPADLTVYRDEHVLLFVPKAQVSQWELQLMVISDCEAGPVGNIFEAGRQVRAALDRAMLLAHHVLARMGAKMVSSIEYPKRLGRTNGQRLLYAFLPKLPWAMGAFSEAQLRFICGHYPEDFARACRAQAEKCVSSQGRETDHQQLGKPV